MKPIIVAAGLHKRFGETHALRGVDLEVPPGTVYGLLGPNGAGKTTVVRILATLALPSSGMARVAGYDVVRDADRVRRRIGLAGQHAAVDEKLPGRENLRMFGRLYHLGEREARRRADELLEQFALADAADRLVSTYSGGMRRRLDLIASLIIAPAVLFLDEPTTGLDPRSRGEIWDAIRTLVAGGTTVLLTTQYLDEADQLADRIGVVDHGLVVADGTPDELKNSIGSRLDVIVRDPATLEVAARVLADTTGSEATVVPEQRQVGVPISVRDMRFADLVRAFDRAGVDAEDIALRRPTLDEVFLSLTGSPANEQSTTEEQSVSEEQAEPMAVR